MTDVLVVGDEVLVSVGLKMILETAGGFVVATSVGRHARSAAEECRPAVVLVDAQTAKPHGVAILNQLCTLTPPPTVAILTALAPSEVVVESLRAGASGLLLRDSKPEQLVVAVRALATGATVLAPEVWSVVLRSSVPGLTADDKVEQLTQREREILKLLGLGLTNAGISRRLFLSNSTVKDCVSGILNKLGVANRVQAAVCAYVAGLTADDLAPPADLAYCAAYR